MISELEVITPNDEIEDIFELHREEYLRFMPFFSTAYDDAILPEFRELGNDDPLVKQIAIRYGIDIEKSIIILKGVGSIERNENEDFLTIRIIVDGKTFGYLRLTAIPREDDPYITHVDNLGVSSSEFKHSLEICSILFGRALDATEVEIMASWGLVNKNGKNVILQTLRSDAGMDFEDFQDDEMIEKNISELSTLLNLTAEESKLIVELTVVDHFIILPDPIVKRREERWPQMSDEDRYRYHTLLKSVEIALRKRKMVKEFLGTPENKVTPEFILERLAGIALANLLFGVDYDNKTRNFTFDRNGLISQIDTHEHVRFQEVVDEGRRYIHEGIHMTKMLDSIINDYKGIFFIILECFRSVGLVTEKPSIVFDDFEEMFITLLRKRVSSLKIGDNSQTLESIFGSISSLNLFYGDEIVQYARDSFDDLDAIINGTSSE